MKNGMIKKFGVSTPAYPWDLKEHGVEGFLDLAIERIGANTVFTPVSYYMEESSAFWWGGVMPGNKKLMRYYPEDGRLYIKPDMQYFTKTNIKPVRTCDPLLEDFDNLAALEGPAKERGMKFDAWLPVFKNPSMARENPECTPVDIFGGRLKHGLCPNNPDVKNYFYSLLRNIVEKYDISGIGLDKFGIEYWAGGPLGEGWYTTDEGGHKWGADIDPEFLLLQAPCFCKHCEKQAREWGYDWDSIKRTVSRLAGNFLKRDASVVFELSKRGHFDGEAGVTRLLLEEEDVYQWMQFKIRTMVETAKAFRSLIKSIKPDVNMGIALDPPDRPNFQRFRHYGWLYGSSYKHLAPHADSIGVASGWTVEEKYYSGLKALETVNGVCPCNEDVHAVLPADPEHVIKQIQTYQKLGFKSFVIFGVTWAPPENLNAAKKELIKIEQSMG